MDELNIEQINSAFESNPELKGQFIESFKGSEEGQTLLNNYAESHWDNKIGTVVGEIHQKYDDDFEQAFGKKRDEGVKTYAFFKDNIADLKSRASAGDPSVLAEKDQTISDLQKKLEEGASNDHFKSLYDELQGQTTGRIEELMGQIKGFEEKERLGSIQGVLKSALSELKFNEDLPKDLVDGHVKGLIDSLTASAKIMEDGTVTFYEGDQPIRNKNFANMSADEILKNRLGSVLAKNNSSGGGVDPNKKDLNDPNRLSASATITSAKTQTQLMSAIENDLIGRGMAKRSKEYQAEMDKLFGEYSKGLPIK